MLIVGLVKAFATKSITYKVIDMTAIYRIDCKLAQHNHPAVRSEPVFLNTVERLNDWLAKQENKPSDHPFKLAFTVNQLVDGEYRPINDM